jgi:hypothetical protein
MALVDAASRGDAGVRSGLLKQWADRRHWSSLQRWQAEGLHMMHERFLKAAEFIDRAGAADKSGVPWFHRGNSLRCSRRLGVECAAAS